MVFDFPGVQESIENSKETTLGKHMLKNLKVLTPMRKNMKMGGTFLRPTSAEISLFSDLDAFWLHFGPQVVSGRHLEPKMMRKWTPEDLKVTTKL